MPFTPREMRYTFRKLITSESQHGKHVAHVHHRKILAWMMMGLIETGLISLTQWAPFVHGRAVFAQSSVRRFAHWLTNNRIAVHQLCGPLIQEALTTWGAHTLNLALDTSLLGEQYCVIRISLIYRGRAIPLFWQVIEHASTGVAYAMYQPLLDQTAALLPLHARVVFLADRGFADVARMRHATQLGWHWRIRIKGCFLVYRQGHRLRKLNNCDLPAGQAQFWHHVQITADRYGPVHLALAHLAETGERWLVISDEVSNLTTLDEYGLRFDIEENFLDDKSNGFQLEASLIYSAAALTRLGLVLALTMLFLVARIPKSSNGTSAAGWMRIGFAATAISRSAGTGCAAPSATAGNCSPSYVSLVSPILNLPGFTKSVCPLPWPDIQSQVCQLRQTIVLSVNQEAS